MLSRKTLWALVVTLLCAAGTASAQDPRGTLTGTVTDSTGAVLPGVTLVMKNTETGVAQQVVTDSDGRYQVLYVNPGHVFGHRGADRLQTVRQRRHPRRRRRRRPARCGRCRRAGSRRR